MNRTLLLSLIAWLAIFGLLVATTTACNGKKSSSSYSDDGGDDADDGGDDADDGGDDADDGGDDADDGGDDGGDGEYKVVASVPDGGTIKGTMVWDGGDASEHVFIPYIAADSDKEICGRDAKRVRGDKRRNPNLELSPIAGKKLGVMNVVIVVMGVTEGLANTGPPTGVAEFDNKDCDFAPHVFLIPRDAKLLIKTSDGDVSHNSKGSFTAWDGSVSGAELFNPQLKGDKKHVHKDFPGDGLLKVICSQHYWMVGYGVVHSHPYVAISGDKGSFSIPAKLKPGKYTIKFWHPSYKFIKQEKDGKVVGGSYDSNDVTWTQEVEIKTGENDLGDIKFSGIK